MGQAAKPLELLKKELKIFQRAKELSDKHFKEGDIDEARHETHLKNLSVLIREYKDAIRTLETYGND